MPLDQYFEQVNQIWSTFIQEQSEGRYQPVENFGYVFVYGLILVDKLRKGNMKIVREMLEKIRDDSEYRAQFECFSPS